MHDHSTASPKAGMTGKQRKFLRGLAHSLKPVVHVGKQGLTDGFFANLDEALEHHELVKIKFVDWKDEKAELTAEIEHRLDCQSAGRIGHNAILFRPARLPENRNIKLPR